MADPGEGVPQRCFWIKKPDGSGIRICVILQTWPFFVLQAWPTHPGPDPAPISIEGVKPELLRDLEVLDGIEFLSRRLSRDTAKAVLEAVSQGVKQVEKQLPSTVSLTAP